MEIPPNTHPIWRDIITGRAKIEFEFVAAKIIHGALTRSFAKDPSPSRLEKCASNLRVFFLENAEQPSAQKDLQKICG